MKSLLTKAILNVVWINLEELVTRASVVSNGIVTIMHAIGTWRLTFVDVWGKAYTRLQDQEKGKPGHANVIASKHVTRAIFTSGSVCCSKGILGSLRNHDDNGNKNVTNLHI